MEAAQEVQLDNAETPTQQEKDEASSPAEAESDKTAEVTRRDDPRQVAAPSLEAEKSGDVTSGAEAKAVGGASPAGSGLPVDEQTEIPDVEGDIEDAYLLSQLADQQMHDPDLVGETEDGSEDPIGQEISSQTLAEGLAQDSDWNAGSLGGEEPEEAIPAGEEFAARGTEELKENLAPFKNNLNTLRQMIAEIQEDNYGNEGNLEDAIKSWEEKLNSIGDDAELADVDLQGILEEQQELINTLSNMGEVQRDTAETVIKKTSAGLSSPAEASETGEEGEGQIIIPAGNSQIDFSGIVGQVSKIDSFTWKLSVSKDEVGDFRIPSLHKAEIDTPARTNRQRGSPSNSR